eukprot:gene8751-24_t
MKSRQLDSAKILNVMHELRDSLGQAFAMMALKNRQARAVQEEMKLQDEQYNSAIDKLVTHNMGLKAEMSGERAELFAQDEPVISGSTGGTSFTPCGVETKDCTQPPPPPKFFNACRYGMQDVVKNLLTGISFAVDAFDDKGNTGLHHACLSGHAEVVSVLLSMGASPDLPCKDPAHFALTPSALAKESGNDQLQLPLSLASRNRNTELPDR